MKSTNINILKAAVVAVSLAMFSVPAQAVLIISGTDVGSLDTVVGAIDSAQSGQAYEEAQLEAFIGQDVTLVDNINTFTVVSQSGNNYIDVSPDDPGFYVLKFGTGNTGNDMFFMSNNDLLQYLAWSDAQLIAAGLPANHVQSLSHYAITSSNGTVPEPSSLVLLGLGLLGFAMRNRWRSTQS